MKKNPATKSQIRMLAKRQAIESIFSFIKHRTSAINRFARSIQGYFVSLLSSVVLYSFNKINKSLFLQCFHNFLIS